MHYFDFGGKRKYPNDDFYKLNTQKGRQRFDSVSLGFLSLSLSFSETPRLYFVPGGSRGLIVITLLFNSTISLMAACDFPLRRIQKVDERRIHITRWAEKKKRIVIAKIQANSFTNSFTNPEKNVTQSCIDGHAFKSKVGLSRDYIFHLILWIWRDCGP